ncbi:hypothetical protein [Anaerovorax odorimutans]|uniref:hypothetical protein n=1 Tax=Anaerovorax odorimutans TaxID=109327 RepID=UPI0004220817|nr:hypothetical protein [Anaerovorax odorimutans]
MNFIQYDNFIIILTILIAIVCCILLLENKYKSQASKILLYLVTLAEQKFGSGTGDLKYSAVSSWLYEKLPNTAKLLLSASVINNLIETAVLEMKVYLESNTKAKAIVESTEQIKEA